MNITDLLSAFAKKFTQSRFERLETRLGVAFFSNLEAISTDRMPTLTDPESCFYIGVLTNALRRKHSWIPDDFGMAFALEILGKDRLELVGATDAYSVASDRAAEIKSSLFSDLLLALGDEASQGTLLSIPQMRLLDKVVSLEAQIERPAPFLVLNP